jgi:hypothetical protein
MLGGISLSYLFILFGQPSFLLIFTFFFSFFLKCHFPLFAWHLDWLASLSQLASSEKTICLPAPKRREKVILVDWVHYEGLDSRMSRLYRHLPTTLQLSRFLPILSLRRWSIFGRNRLDQIQYCDSEHACSIWESNSQLRGRSLLVLALGWSGIH